jgi:branched-subunit amino acid transport protein
MPHVAATDLAAMLGLALLCWGLRVAFVLLVPADRLPAAVARGLQHLAPAAIASICAVELTGALEQSDPSSTAASVAIVGIAAAVALRTRNMTWTVLAGVAAVLVVDLILLAS